MSRRANTKAPDASPARRPDRWAVPGVCLFLAAIIWAVFGQTLHHGFVYDDKDYVTGNLEVSRGLTLPGIVWAFTHVHSDNWHPLTWISHMLDCQWYGLNPGGHHFTNVLLHTATVILLFLVLRRMTGTLWRSALVAAVFAIHPLRVESVAWVAERKDVLSGVFFMLTLLCYVKAVTRDKGQVTGTSIAPASFLSPVTCHPSLFYWLALVFFALGLMCKPMLVTLPCVLMLLDYWPLNRVATATNRPNQFPILGRLILEKLPWFGLAAASCVATLFAQRGAIQSFEALSLPVRVGNALISYVAYLGQMFWPSGLAPFYPITAGSVGVASVGLSLAVLAGISTGVFVLRRHHPYLVTGWLWYLIMLVPVIGMVQVGAQARADRYTYLPQIGLYLLLTWAVADLCAGWRYRRTVLGGGAAVILVALIGCARAQTAYWRDSETLWTHALACTTKNWLGHYGLGTALLQKGAVDDAIVQFQKALQIEPGFAEAHNNLGNALVQKGAVDEAIFHFQKALAMNPGNAQAHNNLGNLLLQKGAVDEAMVQYQQALAISPDYAEAHYNLGNVLLQKGALDEAIFHYQGALEINPDSALAQHNLGLALLQKGAVDEAIHHFQKAVEIKPDFVEARYQLGNALLQKGEVDEAIFQYQKALEINPDDAKAHNHLGTALLQKGQVDEAMVQYEKALKIAPDYAEPLNNLAWVLATCPQASRRNGNQAVALAQRANQLARDGNPTFLGTLAAAYAEAGRFPEAVATVQRALQLAGAQSNPALADDLRSKLKLYQAGLPFHENQSQGKSRN